MSQVPKLPLGYRSDDLRNLRQSLHRKLQKLGRTEKAIVKSLKAIEAKGWPNSPLRCPLAVVTNSVLHPHPCRLFLLDGISVSSSSVVVGGTHHPAFVLFKLTKAQQKFVNNFDDGKYPSLQYSGWESSYCK